MRGGVLTLVLIAVGTVWYAVAGEDPQVSACTRDIKTVEAAYRTDPPKPDSHRAIENTLKHARTWCSEKKFREAESGIDMAAFLCVGNKGCRSLLNEARRQRQSSR